MIPPDDAAEHLARGTAQILPDKALSDLLRRSQDESRPLRVKFGIDPSGSELTLGHAVVLRKLRQFQDLGHLAVLIIGDFTGTVGDPTGRGTGRNAMSLEQTTRNAATYLEQAAMVLDSDRLEVRRNTEWLGGMGLLDVLGYAQNLTIAHLLERDDFATRHRQHKPIALTEFLYPLLQGIDSVAVRADVELGGTDQLFNLTVGRDLQRAAGQRPQLVMTVPLLEGLDGVRKMSKSLGNYVALVQPAAEQFGKLMSIPDGMIERYALLCTDAPGDVLAALARTVEAGGPPAALAKRSVARDIVALYHGQPSADAAEADFDCRFSQRLAPVQAPSLALPQTDPVHLPALLSDSGLCLSRSQARRDIDSGAVRVDGERLEPGVYDVPRQGLSGRTLEVGRRRSARLVEPPTEPDA